MPKQRTIRITFRVASALSALFAAAAVCILTVMTVQGLTPQGFASVLSHCCSCEQGAWIYATQGHYLSCCGGFLGAFTLASCACTYTAIKPSAKASAVAVAATVLLEWVCIYITTPG